MPPKVQKRPAMKRPAAAGKQVVKSMKVKKKPAAVGSRKAVWDGTADHTKNGLRKADLTKNARGKIVSIKNQEKGRKAKQHLKPWDKSVAKAREDMKTRGWDITGAPIGGLTIPGYALGKSAKALYTLEKAKTAANAEEQIREAIPVAGSSASRPVPDRRDSGATAATQLDDASSQGEAMNAVEPEPSPITRASDAGTLPYEDDPENTEGRDPSSGRPRMGSQPRMSEPLPGQELLMPTATAQSGNGEDMEADAAEREPSPGRPRMGLQPRFSET